MKPRRNGSRVRQVMRNHDGLHRIGLKRRVDEQVRLLAHPVGRFGDEALPGVPLFGDLPVSALNIDPLVAAVGSWPASSAEPVRAVVSGLRL